MIKLHIPTMRCGHCATSITKALMALDASVGIDIDITLKIVSISTSYNVDAVAKALQTAGYPYEALGTAKLFAPQP